MPYDNETNRRIAKELNELNLKMLKHEAITNQGMSGGALGSLSGILIPKIVGRMKGYSGGSNGEYASETEGDAEQAQEHADMMGFDGLDGGNGFARGTMMDTGFDRTIGAGMSAGVKKYKKISGIKGAAAPKARGRPRKTAAAPLEGEGFFGDLWSGIKKAAPIIGSIAKTGLSLVPHPGAQAAAGVLDALGAGKKPRGRPRKIIGGSSNLGEPYNMVNAEGLTGNGSSGGALVPVANMQSGVGGVKKRATKAKVAPDAAPKGRRQDIVKQIMLSKGLKMIEASKYVKANNLY